MSFSNSSAPAVTMNSTFNAGIALLLLLGELRLASASAFRIAEVSNRSDESRSRAGIVVTKSL